MRVAGGMYADVRYNTEVGTVSKGYTEMGTVTSIEYVKFCRAENRVYMRCGNEYRVS